MPNQPLATHRLLWRRDHDMKKLLFTIPFFTLLYLSLATSAQAACNFHSNMTNSTKDVTWSNSCTIAAGTINGIDKGTGANTAKLTLSGGAITINNTAQLIVGSLQLNSGSTVAVQAGGTIKVGDPIYVTDADADGWANNFTLYNTSASGRRRLSQLINYGTADCNDVNDYRLDNVCCTVGTYYADNDGDGYGAGAAHQICPTAGYVANNSDCYDSNPNAHPGSTTCSTSNRGDGSYDYNCSGTNTACGTSYYPYSSVTEYHYSDYMRRCNNYGLKTIILATASPNNCGVSGGYSRGTYEAAHSCWGTTPANYALGTMGTQACQ